MAIFRRGRRHPQDPGMTPFRAGLMCLVILLVATYFGFTKANPFANPYELKATFDTANNLKPRSPVRIAGVEVGKVTKVEPITEGEGAARVTMEIKESGLPIHEDAQLKIRQRIFLEGNFFVDLQPGSPGSPVLESGGDPIPVQQTAAPVQFGQVLEALQADTREDLRTFLREYSKGLSGKGAKGFNDSIKYWESAYKNSALANDATLGEEPTRDLQRILKNQAIVARALTTDEEALKGLIVNLNTTAGALAREDVALEASIPALRDTLREAQPALASLNGALPALRAFSRDALPGTRSSNATLRESLPFIRQLRALVRRRELRGFASVLRRYIPDLVRLNEASVPLSEQGRSLSRCVNRVLVPFNQSRIPSPHEESKGNSNQQVRFQTQRGFPGLSGESRLHDGNNQWFHGMGVPNPLNVRPAPPTVVDQPPPRRPDVPCETQEPPNLNAPGGPATAMASTPRQRAAARRSRRSFDGRALKRAGELLAEHEERQRAKWRRDAKEAKAKGARR
jgi:phospholipid/cholesterol/gamma-HCH transport system substrate-binding protein